MYLYFLEWVVVDIRKQFPLLAMEMIQEISKQLGINHANVGIPSHYDHRFCNYSDNSKRHD